MESPNHDRLAIFNREFLAHKDVLTLLISRVLRFHQADVADVLHDVWIKCAMSAARCEVTHYKEWMNRAAIHTAISYFQRNGRKHPWLARSDEKPAPEPADTAPLAPDVLDGHETRHHVRKALAKLRKSCPGQVAALHLVFIEGRTHAQAAVLLGITTGTSKSNVSKGKDNLLLMLPADLKAA